MPRLWPLAGSPRPGDLAEPSLAPKNRRPTGPFSSNPAPDHPAGLAGASRRGESTRFLSILVGAAAETHLDPKDRSTAPALAGP
jgi:hypothetical protein